MVQNDTFRVIRVNNSLNRVRSRMLAAGADKRGRSSPTRNTAPFDKTIQDTIPWNTSEFFAKISLHPKLFPSNVSPKSEIIAGPSPLLISQTPEFSDVGLTKLRICRVGMTLNRL